MNLVVLHPFDLIIRKPIIMLFSGHVLVNASRLAVFAYAYLNFGLLNVVLWSIVCILYLTFIVWEQKNSQYEAIKRYYKALEILFHVVFHTFFVYSALYFKQFELLFFEISIYWTFELILVIFNAQAKFKLELDKLAATQIVAA